MKTSIIFLFTVVAFVIVSYTQSSAQLKPTSSLLSVTGAYTIIGIKDSGETIDGGGFQFGFENVNKKGNVAVGVALGYLEG